MPHDKNGTELKVGDKVTIEAEVTSISPTPDYCNLTVKSTEGRKPDGLKETITLNAAVVVKAGLVLLAVFVLGCRPVRAADIGSPVPLERRVAELDRRVTALERLGGQTVLPPLARARVECGPDGCRLVPGTAVAPAYGNLQYVPAAAGEMYFTPQYTAGGSCGVQYQPQRRGLFGRRR